MKLVIAEKPSVAKSIADIIGAKDKRDGYIEGNEYIVSWCVGHLIELATLEGYDESLRKWSYETLPIVPEEWQYEVKAETKAQYNVLKKLMNDNRISTVICDTEEEPEVDLKSLTQNIRETDQSIKERNEALLGMLKDLSFKNDSTKEAVDEFIKVLE